MDAKLRNLTIEDIQCDEIFGFVQKKNRNVRPTDNAMLVGDQYTYIALDPKTKTRHRFPRRQARCSWIPLVLIVVRSSGIRSRNQLRSAHENLQQEIRCPLFPSRGHGRIRTAISGAPIETKISTSLVERSNLNVRTFMRRMTRLCLGFSKKLENLKHAAALYFAWSNFVRVTTRSNDACGSERTNRPRHGRGRVIEGSIE
jgi:hypothetical protein